MRESETEMPHDSVIELRRYTLHPGARETLIKLFDRELVETQEEVGMRVLGQFRDLGDPEQFVWLRGFRDLASRAPALAAFYGGPVWAAHRNAANATMVDSDNVLLLRPAPPTSGFTTSARPRPATQARDGIVVATICHVEPSAASELGRLVATAFARGDVPMLAVLVTETAANDFPALPIREDAHDVVVWLTAMPEATGDEDPSDLLERWRALLPASLVERLGDEPDVLRLAPTPRSSVVA